MSPFPVSFHTDTEGFQPFLRDDDTLARVWAIPGTPDLMHRIGGIERDYDTGHISYDPDNHQRMTKVRAAKIEASPTTSPQTVETRQRQAWLWSVGGRPMGRSTAPFDNADARRQGRRHIHLRNIWPLPKTWASLLAVMSKFDSGDEQRPIDHAVAREYLVPPGAEQRSPASRSRSRKSKTRSLAM